MTATTLQGWTLDGRGSYEAAGRDSEGAGTNSKIAGMASEGARREGTRRNAAGRTSEGARREGTRSKAAGRTS